MRAAASASYDAAGAGTHRVAEAPGILCSAVRQRRTSVYLVGAGPGDPELLTLRAARLLGTANVVLHDALVSAEILRLAAPAAQVIDVGKRCGRKAVSQEQINALLVDFGSRFEAVVRLKGGDPSLFGRAGEEIEALRAAGIAFEIVPGITSALASSAAAGISLTRRGVASHVVFVTGHYAAGSATLELDGIARPDTTIVIYMPGDDYRRVAETVLRSGLRLETPCAVVSRAGIAGEQILRTSVGGLRGARPLPAPALLIIGAVAGAPVEEIIGPYWQAAANAAIDTASSYSGSRE